jgi:hypothetical protein
MNFFHKKFFFNSGNCKKNKNASTLSSAGLYSFIHGDWRGRREEGGGGERGEEGV